jgi:hypothetical protein
MTPGRWITLIVGVPVVLAFIAANALSIVSQIGEGTFPIQHKFQISHGQLTAQFDAGDITLRQATAGSPASQSATLSGTATYSLSRSTVTYSDSTVGYSCPWQFSGNCSLSASLQVPADTVVSLSTGGGDVTIPGFASPLTLRTDGGNVNAGHLRGTLGVDSSGGDVTVGVLDGPLQVNLDGGNLNIGAMSAGRAVITSGGGDVNLVFTKAPSSVQITSDGGNVTLFLPRSGRYNISDNADGGNFNDPLPNYPSSKNTIGVDSAGGDINIVPAG